MKRQEYMLLQSCHIFYCDFVKIKFKVSEIEILEVCYVLTIMDWHNILKSKQFSFQLLFLTKIKI